MQNAKCLILHFAFLILHSKSMDFPALRAALASRDPITRAEWEARPAAVLVPLFWRDGEWHVLLTRRPDTLKSHTGQVAFPGGKVDPQDATREDTALREAYEEIGLRPQDVRLLGRLDDLLTVTQWRVTPVVGVFDWPYAFTPSPGEVAAIFSAPLRWLADPANLVIQYREPIAPGPKIPVYHWYYEGFDIWGATARMLRNLLEVTGGLL
jgi:8-oxo-dGTP pyrophosphatase MutT (NUDIX family)